MLHRICNKHVYRVVAQVSVVFAYWQLSIDSAALSVVSAKLIVPQWNYRAARLCWRWRERAIVQFILEPPLHCSYGVCWALRAPQSESRSEPQTEIEHFKYCKLWRKESTEGFNFKRSRKLFHTENFKKSRRGNCLLLPQCSYAYEHFCSQLVIAGSLFCKHTETVSLEISDMTVWMC